MTERVLGLAEHAARALLDDRQFDAEVEQRVGGLVRVGLADGDLALLAVADGDGDVLQRALHLLGRGGGRLPEHRAVVQVEDRQRAPVPAGLPRGEVCTAAWLFGQPGHRRPVQPRRSNGVGVDLAGGDLQVGRAGLAVEVQREVVGREDLAERHRRRVLVVRRDVAVVDAEPVQLGADEPAERVVADAGDQRGAVAEPGGRHRDVGGAAAEKLAERLDVFEADADLQWIDVDAAAADGEHVERL